MLTPGVVSDSNGYGLVSIRGVSPLMNNVLIDGADDNQAFFSEERGRTREAYSTSADSVQEFSVNTGVFPAEFGRAAGGVINSVTKSGSNQLHGEAYFYTRQSNWAAYTPGATQRRAGPDQRQVGGGGGDQAGGHPQDLGRSLRASCSHQETSCSGITPTTSTTASSRVSAVRRTQRRSIRCRRRTSRRTKPAV